MFDKVLIADRGEIAIRIMRTCNRMGISTVAVYSDAESHSLHRQMANESIHIGGPCVQESYLNGERIIYAALETGCQAIHPGYGFLSENAIFARSVETAGLTFIGPSAGVIAMLSDKITAKNLAIKAGVPVIPGHSDTLKDEDEALALAESIGYPVLLKPVAGCNAKGLRIVYGPGEMEAAIAASRQETRKAFGNSRIFMERFIEQSRHVEIQILADSLGNVVHLGERECSIQRQYQKFIAESPSPAVSEDLRRRMGQAACDLARKVGYINTGTIEFILDAHGAFYFLEINPHLPEEHAVTELLTGLDLVELQLRIACDEALPCDQASLIFDGWAIQAHIYAEDPNRDFIPSTGIITRYSEPNGNAIRVDSGVKAGSRIGSYYDSLLAKVISHGKERETARNGLVEALNGYYIGGVATNIDFANRLMSHSEFAKGNFNTNFINRHFNTIRRYMQAV
ncbi:MAG: biotin carboxylase N-terminal domain-containing protein [Pseudomonadota bacterium]